MPARPAPRSQDPHTLQYALGDTSAHGCGYRIDGHFIGRHQEHVSAGGKSSHCGITAGNLARCLPSEGIGDNDSLKPNSSLRTPVRIFGRAWPGDQGHREPHRDRAVITESVPLRIAARKAPTDLLQARLICRDRGGFRCVSVAVSPCPGKCFAVVSTRDFLVRNERLRKQIQRGYVGGSSP